MKGIGISVKGSEADLIEECCKFVGASPSGLAKMCLMKECRRIKKEMTNTTE